MGNISENFRKVQDTIPSGVSLVAISKTKSKEDIMEVYDCGQRVFGESKAQELVPKYEELPRDIEWHMVGHLQSNKVKYIAPFVSMIHSVDSMKLLKAINKEGKKNERVIDCLLQMHIAEEDTKFGLDYEELTGILGSEEFAKMNNIRIRGLMCMATYTEDTEQVSREFRQLIKYFDQARSNFFPGDDTFTIKSMGMSDDYEIAIREGSNMVRVGSRIFGSR